MILTKEAFQAWLDSKEADQVVGYARRYGDCPMARYLKETDPKGRRYGVRSFCYDRYGECSGVYFGDRLPAWAQKFVKLVDDEHVCDNVGKAVTAKMAREALDAIFEGDADILAFTSF